jgi:hypothetical protein
MRRSCGVFFYIISTISLVVMSVVAIHQDHEDKIERELATVREEIFQRHVAGDWAGMAQICQRIGAKVGDHVECEITQHTPDFTAMRLSYREGGETVASRSVTFRPWEETSFSIKK